MTTELSITVNPDDERNFGVLKEKILRMLRDKGLTKRGVREMYFENHSGNIGADDAIAVFIKNR